MRVEVVGTVLVAEEEPEVVVEKDVTGGEESEIVEEIVIEPDDGIGVVDMELRRYGVKPEVVLPVGTLVIVVEESKKGR